MACFVPFDGRNLDICFFIFRPTVVLIEELVDALKHFSLCTESLGCVQSSIFRSIHGNLVIWYGAWMKISSTENNKDLLTSAVLPLLANLSSKAILIEHNFFDPYAGESREGSSVARFCTGDIIFMNIAVPSAGDLNDLSYANLALFRDGFLKMEGALSGVCLKCCHNNIPRVSCLYVWKSLQCCYSWILNTDFRKTVLPYLDRFKLNLKYDVFRVVFVSTEASLSCQNVVSSAHMLANEGETTKDEQQVMQN
ncbi:Serine incorporator 4 [Melia azedarach]|uniref:Serine incorporator 4 n=1 Tax=Melia azedarach TaxID=155640 RepID=A0ACC1WVB2_MELAZ|nr:Serine incorporator 4 [Melia azedarach]